ncbi:MAG TPA: sialidase family protein [Candidatus Limnocylindria bacterium]|jgi:predicted neuraminidase|nr:sialidase family protein [Candidatus Limnocylindria bacterium]
MSRAESRALTALNLLGASSWTAILEGWVGMRFRSIEYGFAVAALVVAACGAASPPQPLFEVGVVARSDPQQFVMNAYPVVARLASGRLLCIFSVETLAKPAKMNIAASTSDDGGKAWSQPTIVFDHPNAEDADPNLLVDGDRVLAFSTTVPEPVRIDYSMIYMRESKDGVHWGEEVLLKTPHRYIAGKIHQGHRLADGALVIGYAWDTWAEQRMPPATEGEMDIKSGVLRSTDGGKNWTAGGDMYSQIPKTSPHAVMGLDEPATVVLADGRLMALLRTSGTNLLQSWSSDGGLNWKTPSASTLTAHNSPAALWKLDGSQDVLVAWDNLPTARTALAAALSADGGVTWSKPKVIVDTHGSQEVSYPSAGQAKDGTMIVVWQQQLAQGGREIRIARFNRAWLLGESEGTD